MSWLSSLFKGGKKSGGSSSSASSSSSITAPPVYSSPYAADTAKQLHGIYSGRAAGKDVGFAPEDLGTMKAEAIDTSTGEMNEALRRGLAARRITGPGGMTTGGAARLHERSLLSGLQSRSKAMRDVAIKNAVLKRQEQQQGITGLHNFLTTERGAEQTTGATDFQSQLYNAYLNQPQQNPLLSSLMGLGGTLGSYFLNR